MKSLKGLSAFFVSHSLSWALVSSSRALFALRRSFSLIVKMGSEAVLFSLSYQLKLLHLSAMNYSFLILLLIELKNALQLDLRIFLRLRSYDC